MWFRRQSRRGARVVGFDVVFASSIENSQIRFGDDTVGDKLRGFDRDYLRALAARRTSWQDRPRRDREPHPIDTPDSRAEARRRGSRQSASLNVHTDIDDVVRRAPLIFSDQEGFIPSMALELASRALRSRAEDRLR